MNAGHPITPAGMLFGFFTVIFCIVFANMLDSIEREQSQEHDPY